MPPDLHVPLALHEAAIERLFARDPRTRAPIADDVLAGAEAAMRTARASAEQVAAMAAALHRDPTRTPPQVAVELRRVVPAIAERMGAALDGAAERVSGALKGLDAQMAPPAPASAEAVQIASEVRAHLLRMDTTARANALAAAVSAGDDTTISAALRGAPLLTGMTPEQHQALRGRWQAARHPEAFVRAQRLRKAGEVLAQAGAASVDFVTATVTLPGAAAAEAAAAAAHAAVREARA